MSSFEWRLVAPIAGAESAASGGKLFDAAVIQARGSYSSASRQPISGRLGVRFGLTALVCRCDKHRVRGGYVDHGLCGMASESFSLALRRHGLNGAGHQDPTGAPCEARWRHELTG